MKLKRQQRGHSSGEHRTGILAGEEGKLQAEAFVLSFSGAVLWGSEKSLTGRFNFEVSMKPEYRIAVRQKQTFFKVMTLAKTTLPQINVLLQLQN